MTEDDVRRWIREEMDMAFRGFYQQQAMQQLKVIESLGFTIVPQATPTDQEGQDDTQAGQVDSVTAD